MTTPTTARQAAVTLGALGLSATATPLAARLARRLGVVDRPGPLKPQRRAVPYLGGLGVAAGLGVGVAAGRRRLAVPLALALGLGVADDVRPIPPVLRLLGQLGVGAATAVAVDTRLAGPVGRAAVALAAVGLMNGCNLLDGLDGLCGSVALAAAGGFAAILTGRSAILALAMAGGTAGFLLHNAPPARVYLGDGGAYLIGAALAALVADAWGPGRSLSTGLGALALVALPAGELGLAVVRRARGRRSLLAGDRDHPYDQLVRRGWTPRRAAAAYAAAGLVTAAVARLATGQPAPAAGALVAATLAALVRVGWPLGSRPDEVPTAAVAG